jgi:hypothetical protein
MTVRLKGKLSCLEKCSDFISTQHIWVVADVITATSSFVHNNDNNKQRNEQNCRKRDRNFIIVSVAIKTLQFIELMERQQTK